MSLELHNTRMGHRLIESTLPTIGRELGQLNRNLDRIATSFEQKAEPTSAAPELISKLKELADYVRCEYAASHPLCERAEEALALVAKAEGRAA